MAHVELPLLVEWVRSSRTTEGLRRLLAAEQQQLKDERAPTDAELREVCEAFLNHLWWVYNAPAAWECVGGATIYDDAHGLAVLINVDRKPPRSPPRNEDVAATASADGALLDDDSWTAMTAVIGMHELAHFARRRLGRLYPTPACVMAALGCANTDAGYALEALVLGESIGDYLSSAMAARVLAGPQANHVAPSSSPT